MAKRMTVFCGNFGSGKTELAMAYAKQLAKKGEKVTLVDMDFVNPYFTSSHQREQLSGLGIRFIGPRYSTTGVDVPSLSPEVFSVFAEKESKVIFDLGGDPIGAVAMGSLSSRIKENGGAEMLFVLNPYRPLVRDTQSAKDLLLAIEAESHMKATGIINNANLGAESEAEHLIYGQQAALALAKEMGIEIKYYGATKEVLTTLEDGTLMGEAIVVERLNRQEWML